MVRFMHRQFVSVVSTVAVGLAATAVLSLGAGPVQAESMLGSAARLIPSGNEWWFSSWQVQQKVWPLTQGSGVTVAVLDTGVQASLPDLRGVVRPGLDLTGHGSRGEVDVDDGEDGHGTAVAVLIAGQGYGTGTVGIAPEARILPVAFPSAPGGDGNFTSAEVAEAVRFAVDHGARVINMSFGGPATSQLNCDPAEQDVFAYALEHNVVLVAGAGNTERSGIGPIEPAACAGVLAVGGVEPDGSLWPYSDQQPYVAVTAPGAHMVYVGRDERYTTTGVGTSYSAALVSAAAALILSRYPSMPWYQVDQRLMATARPAGRPVPNNAFGYGIVDLAKAVNASAYPVSTSGRNPVYAAFKAWLTTPAGQLFAAQNGITSPLPPSAAAGPVPRATASAVRHVGQSRPVGRVVLVAVAVAVVVAVAVAAGGALAVLRARARARSRRRSPAAGKRRPRRVHDWRMLPPRYDDDPADDEAPFAEADDEAPFADQEGYEPPWRYGAPQGYERGYDLDDDPDYRPAHVGDQDPAYGPGRRPPWGFADDAPREEWS